MIRRLEEADRVALDGEEAESTSLSDFSAGFGSSNLYNKSYVSKSLSCLALSTADNRSFEYHLINRVHWNTILYNPR
jgi:hypothetical protein